VSVSRPVLDPTKVAPGDARVWLSRSVADPGRLLLRIGTGLGVLALAALLAVATGAVQVPPAAAATIVVNHLPFVDLHLTYPETWDTIVWQLRLPRIVLAALVGAALALSGGTYQGLFRNPLADPYLIGVAGGAGLGATIVLITSVPSNLGGVSLLPIAAFAGATLAVTAAYLVSKRAGGISLTTLILAGVAISSLAGGFTGLLMIRASPDVRPLLGWLFGGFVGAGWDEVRVVIPYLLVGAAGMIAHGRVLNVMQIDEDEARQLGVNVERTKVVLIVLATLTTAAAVSVSGLIGFVGLIAPHAVRLVWGRDYRVLLPLAALAGATFLILADLVARTAAAPSELPVGLITAMCGAPFFIYLLMRRRAIS